MDQINISSWSASYSYDEETIYFSLQFQNFAYISADSSSSDQVRIDFLYPDIFISKDSGVAMKVDRSNLGNRIVKQMPQTEAIENFVGATESG